MPAENKGLKIAILIILTLAISLAGCRLLDPHSSFDYGSESAAPVSSLSGTVLVKPGDLTSIRGNRNPARTSLLAADLSGLVSIAGAEVWIEELPDVAHQITDQDGKYTFKDLPPGNFRIVSAFKKADNNVMKVRSEPVEIVSAAETATASAIVLAPANKEVSGILRDENGDFLPTGTMLILWGEKFYVEAEGRFTSPPLPDDVEMADIIVARAEVAVVDRPAIPVQFYSPEEPTVVEMQVATTDESFRPFTAALTVKINGQAVSVVNVIQNTDIVDLTVNLIGLDRNTSGIIYDWDSGRGNFAAYPTVGESAIWIAPVTSGMAVISVQISAPGRGSFKLSLPLVVDVPVKAPRYSLTFAANSGSPVAAQSVEAEAKALEPAPPTRAGYKFAGWYKEAGLVNQWDFELDKVMAATTVYARWVADEIPTFSLIFSTLGGSPLAAQTAESGSLAKQPASTIRTGYNFVGWFKEAELINQWNFTVK